MVLLPMLSPVVEPVRPLATMTSLTLVAYATQVAAPRELFQAGLLIT